MLPTSTSSLRHLRRLPVALCAILLPALAAAAKPPVLPAGAETFHPTLSYVLRVEEKVVPGARSYATERGDVYLIVSAQLPGPVRLDLRSREVATLARVPAERGGVLVVPAGEPRKPQGQYEIQNGSPRFTVEGKRARLEYPPPLLGLQPVAAIRSYNPDYDRRAAAYRPDATAVAKLAAVQEPVRLRVYFGTWCPTCTETLPNLMKVLQALKGAPFTVEYYGLPPDLDTDPERARRNVQRVPTAIVYRRGAEVGRITDDQWLRPDLALRAILVP
jgi:thiol-disulfide isomerase/thioredoxin